MDKKETTRRQERKGKTMKNGKAAIWTVSIECPYCGGECVDLNSGSMKIEWQSDSDVVCNDCGKRVGRPKRAS